MFVGTNWEGSQLPRNHEQDASKVSVAVFLSTSLTAIPRKLTNPPPPFPTWDRDVVGYKYIGKGEWGVSLGSLLNLVVFLAQVSGDYLDLPFFRCRVQW